MNISEETEPLENFHFQEYPHHVHLLRYKGTSQKVVVPSHVQEKPVTVLSQKAFANHQQLEEVLLPPTLEDLEASVFAQCNQLKEVHFSQNLCTIGPLCFHGCTQLTQVVLPSSLEQISLEAFRECSGLEKVVALNPNLKIYPSTFQDTDALVEINFFLWKSLNRQQLSRLMENRLDRWTLLSSEEQKEMGFFIKKRPALQYLLFHSGNPAVISLLLHLGITPTLDALKEYLEHAIQQHSTETTAILLEYKARAFSPDQQHQHQELQELLEIGLVVPTVKQLKSKWVVHKKEGSFHVSGYKGKEKIELLPGETSDGTPIRSIGPNKKFPFTPVEKLTLDDSIEIIDANTFQDCTTLEEISLPRNLKELGGRCFLNCNNLHTVHIPQGITSLPEQTFQNCTSLREVVLPESITHLEPGVFKGCTALEKVTLPSGLKKISLHLFSNCVSLKEVNLPLFLEEVEQCAFESCHLLLDQNGFFINNHSLLLYSGNSSLLSVPDGVKIIWCGVFASQKHTQIHLPEGLEEIRSFAFAYNNQVEEIVFPKSLKFIQDYAFAFCSNLKTAIFLGDTNREEHAFAGCSNLPNRKPT